ncbi:FAD-binding monooxygenase [Nitrospira sp.]|nr:FAD-binding monooxygenase [Nitrospira sp.]
MLPDREEVRKGALQAAHAHGLLASGYRVLDDYFPGMMDELEALGAPRGDVTGDFLWFQYGRWKLRHQSGLRGITVSRPCLETAVRRRVKALPNVTFLEQTEGIHPLYDQTAGRVTGVAVRRRDDQVEQRLNADLVIDASGRGSQSPKWLQQWGYDPPVEISIRINVGYATRIFERRPGELSNSIGGLISGTPPASTRYAAVLAAERNRWVVTLVGTVRDYPPTNEEEWLAFAEHLPVPLVHELVSAARPLTGITSYRFPTNQRRLYENMKRFPSGYLVLGDALCSFNPIYGQGMSVAAAEAKALQDCIAMGLEGLSQRFYQRVGRIVDIPWTIATGEDFRFPQVEGRRPFGSWFINPYMERVHAVASRDRVVCRKFFEVLNLLAAPQSLMAPRVAWRVLANSLRGDK